MRTNMSPQQMAFQEQSQQNLGLAYELIVAFESMKESEELASRQFQTRMQEILQGVLQVFTDIHELSEMNNQKATGAEHLLAFVARKREQYMGINGTGFTQT